MSTDDPNSGSVQFIPRDLEWLLLSWTLPESLGEVTVLLGSVCLQR